MTVLTDEQQAALEAFFSFMSNTTESAFVLSGYSGTGKSTLVKELLDRWPDYQKALKLLCPKQFQYDIQLTATTNKAAENLQYITGRDVSTIHSYLGLRVDVNYATGATTLVDRNNQRKVNALVFIDEASYVDSALLGLIFQKTKNCKIVFIGDPAQLTPVKSTSTPVFLAPFPGAKLTQVVRQAEGNPIIALATKFRETVTSGDFFSFIPDGVSITHMPRQDFNDAVVNEFSRTDWKFRDSKVMGWTNKCAIAYNNAITDSVNGTPEFQVGDYAVCNKFITLHRRSIKTDQMVCITDIRTGASEHDVDGSYITVDHSITAFFPDSRDAAKARLKRAKAEEDINTVASIESTWIDLRAAYSCTINKAQGSTFDRVFIDLTDVSKCRNSNQLARMLYVAVSRARHQVVFTGDII